jgi:hypothetical protein
MLQVLSTFRKYEHFYTIKEGCNALLNKVIELDIELEDVSQERLMEMLRGGKV